MTNKNNWQALSMRDRAFLIREAVRNGITDINSIRDTWEHRFDGESNQPSEEKPWYKKLASAISEGGRMARDARIGAVGAGPIRQLYKEGKTEEAQELAKQYAKANIAGMTMVAGAANPYGIIGDLGITTVSTLADTAIEGNGKNLGKDLGTNLTFDLVGGTLQWLPKVIKGGKQLAKNVKALRQDYIVRPSMPKVKAMYDHSPKWYNFPHEYEFHLATATPKKYMGELFYAPALEKAATKTAEINKTSLLDMIKEHKVPQYETTHIQLDGKTLDDILDEPASLYISSSSTGIGGYDGIKGSNIDLSHSSLSSHTSMVHEKQHAVQRATNAGKADVTQYALGDYRLFPKHGALRSGYHKILSDQADFLKELDTGLPADSKGTITDLVFKTDDSRNIRELNATVTESLYKMFKNRLPYHDERFMTKEMLDLYKTEIAEMTSEEFIKEFSKDANAYATDYLRGIEKIKKKDPARAEYLTKRLKDLVINQYF